MNSTRRVKLLVHRQMEAIQVMAVVQLGSRLSEREFNAIELYIEAMSGEVPGD